MRTLYFEINGQTLRMYAFKNSGEVSYTVDLGSR